MTTLRLLQGDSALRLPRLARGSVGAVACDPPYVLSTSSGTNPGRRSWAMFRQAQNEDEVPEGRVRRAKKPATARGFMGMTWDGEEIAFSPEFWQEVLGVLAPGGVAKVFGGTRTFHRLAAAMEAAGFMDLHLEAWAYSSGFPKSHDTSKSIDRMKGAVREVVGYKRGVGGENMNDIVRGVRIRDTSEDGARGVGAYGTGAKQVAIEIPVTAPATPEARLWEGWGTALKPAWEPILVGTKP